MRTTTTRQSHETRHTFATLMLDAGELPGWVQQMMGHETLQMIHDRYYLYIKNYRRDDGSAFMENVYNVSKSQELDDVDEKCAPNVLQMKNGKLVVKTNLP